MTEAEAASVQAPPVAALPASPPMVDDEASDKLTDRFLKITGYKEKDIIGSSKARRTFVTSNGGKYEVNKGGTEVRVLSGPNYPKQS